MAPFRRDDAHCDRDTAFRAVIVQDRTAEVQATDAILGYSWDKKFVMLLSPKSWYLLDVESDVET